MTARRAGRAPSAVLAGRAEAVPPAASFAELAVELRLIAFREARGVEAMETHATQLPVAPITLAEAIEEARLRAGLAAQAARLIKALIPFEAELRSLLDIEGEGT